MAEIITIDKDECLGCETCAELCPQAFVMNDEGKAEVHPDADPDQDCVDEAIGACPAGCINKE